EESLAECNKFQNENRDMVTAVKTIQNHGMEVLGGFIVGFDSDPESIFDSQINFIQNIGVATAMVGILTALPKTRLYNRLKQEGRLLKSSSGNNTDASINFVPKMDREVIIRGYQRILQTIYSPKTYYERINTFLEEYKPTRKRRRIKFMDIRGLFLSIWYQGIVGKKRRYYWKFMTKAFFRHRRSFREAVTLSVYGHHFRKIVESVHKAPVTD
ncbi:MAG: DUF4070 domain-containing protein, partial [Chloroflexi bacterium]|nr:DUF4070 domain-containing protein [Chloroflexota bacterium]